MFITHYDQTETKMGVWLLAALKRMLLIIDNQFVFLETLKILFKIYYYLNQNPSLGIIYIPSTMHQANYDFSQVISA